MKSIKLFLFFLLSLSLTTPSCKDPCKNISCSNGGMCIEGTCNCYNGFSGSSCEVEDRCITQNIMCENSGTCIDGICNCLNGFSGSSCEVEDKCITRNITCENSGTCIDGICNCPDGFSGFNCSVEDRCISQNVDCLNGGICEDGICECLEGYGGANCEIECPDGYTVTTCESYDNEFIQSMLDAGQTPIDIYNKGVPLESLYGKIYMDGLIFYLDTLDGTGLLAAFEDQGTAFWGCMGTDITGVGNVTSDPPISGIETQAGARIGDGKINTEAILADCNVDEIAVQLCVDLGREWFLPSRGELNLMYTNLYLHKHGSFYSFYWTSTEFDSRESWFQNFQSNGLQNSFYKNSYVTGLGIGGVRAAKSF